MTAVFQLDESPMESVRLRNVLYNSENQFFGKIFHLVFYEVVIDEIWDMPAITSNLNGTT